MREDLWDTCDKQVSEMCVCSYLWEDPQEDLMDWGANSQEISRKTNL